MVFDRVPAELKEVKQKKVILSGYLSKRTAELSCGKPFCCYCEVGSIIRKDEIKFLINYLSLTETT